MTTNTSTISGTSEPLVTIANGSAGAAGGSVINVSALVSELVAAAQGPQEAVIESQTSAVTAQISAVGSLQSALSSFQASLAALATPAAFASLSATSSDATVVTAAASGSTDAVSGSYSMTVSQLASAQQLLSAQSFSGGSAGVVGTGTLSLSLGASSFDVVIDSSNDTLSGIAAAINAASGNPGISATVLQGSDGAYLLLSSAQSGAHNAIQVSETDAGTGLAALTYGSGNTTNYKEQSQPLDAQFTIAGVAYDSASNTVSDALPGVTLNLLDTTAVGESATITVANDTATVNDNIQGFVSAYNTLQGTLSSLGSYDATSGSAGPLMGNPLLSVIRNRIQSTLYSQVGSSNYNTLASIGITTSSDGTLAVNGTTLQAALSSNFSAVSQLFSGTSGVAAQLNTQLTTDLATGGPIATTNQTLASQEKALTQQSDTLNARMASLTQSLTEQYAALNTLLSSLQSTSAYLTEAFATLPLVQGRPNA